MDEEMKRRSIIEIDEDKCTGCGQCILACAEGALILEDGKARLVGEIYCDGLGVCIGECPEGALTIVERTAEEFDEVAVDELRKGKEEAAVKSGAFPETMACGCPGIMAQSLILPEPLQVERQVGEVQSALGHWPIKLQLLAPRAEFLKGTDFVLLADCVGVAFPDLHRRILRGRAIAMGCPKLDNLEAHTDRLTEILKVAKPKSLTVAYMEVPCCRGFVHAAEEAIRRSGVDLPLGQMIIGIKGDLSP